MNRTCYRSWSIALLRLLMLRLRTFTPLILCRSDSTQNRCVNSFEALDQLNLAHLFWRRNIANLQINFRALTRPSMHNLRNLFTYSLFSSRARPRRFSHRYQVIDATQAMVMLTSSAASSHGFFPPRSTIHNHVLRKLLCCILVLSDVARIE